jgi:hypothetical protein
MSDFDDDDGGGGGEEVDVQFEWIVDCFFMNDLYSSFI